MLVKLESVGAVLDTKELIVYPLTDTGYCDIENIFDLNTDEVSDEWYSSMSEEDRLMVAAVEIEWEKKNK